MRAVTSSHRLLTRLLTGLWELKLAREFRTVDDGIPHSERLPRRIEAGAEFFRQVGTKAWGLRNVTDKKIALAISEGKPWRQIKKELGVGQCRIERVLSKLVRTRKTPWYRRPRALEGRNSRRHPRSTQAASTRA